MSPILTEDIKHEKFGLCCRLSNEIIEMIIPYSFGPRIIHFGFCGGWNEFCDDIPTELEVAEDKWKMVGGHRFWHSPEQFPRTYTPDNEAVEIEKNDTGVIVIQKEEKWVQVQKELHVNITESTGVRVTHKLTNRNAWDIELALWGLSVMAPGGQEWIQQPNRDTGFLNNRNLSLWPYTDMSDARVKWGKNYIVLSHNPKIQQAFKIGLSNEAGWAAYFNRGNMFVKKISHQLNEVYPDGGCSYETYLNEYMLEMESLSPMARIKPGESVLHTEYWNLFKGVLAPSNEVEMDGIVKEEIEKD